MGRNIDPPFFRIEVVHVLRLPLKTSPKRGPLFGEPHIAHKQEGAPRCPQCASHGAARGYPKSPSAWVPASHQLGVWRPAFWRHSRGGKPHLPSRTRFKSKSKPPIQTNPKKAQSLSHPKLRSSNMTDLSHAIGLSAECILQVVSN